GAGPGDPGLITVKGLALLRSADVVVYDRLIPHELLDEAHPSAELIDAGKAPGDHRLSQAEINAILVERARMGFLVVRLKGGDPFIFGRGSEEALACFAAGIAFEVIPGISSVHAVPAYAGIPLTHRNISSVFTVIAGHEDPASPGTPINYEALAQMGGTLVILMGVGHLPEIVTRLIGAGLAPDTPAACIERGTIPEQRVIEAPLVDLPACAARAALQSPAVIVIGDVVALRSIGVGWFENVRPAHIK
ncbi:MAG: uroporphyrinogen-III C-methyltransferase, partial [Chloroflexi bacterium]|nr:uroporphyrinogen-III C-methyltransferase [Chloroflexota bacterium]